MDRRQNVPDTRLSCLDISNNIEFKYYKDTRTREVLMPRSEIAPAWLLQVKRKIYLKQVTLHFGFDLI